MNLTQLPSAGDISLAWEVREILARAISEVQIAASAGVVVTSKRAQLAALFSAAAAAVLDAEFDVPAAGTFTTVVNGQTITLKDSTGATATGTATKNSPATIHVAAGVLTDVQASA